MPKGISQIKNREFRKKYWNQYRDRNRALLDLLVNEDSAPIPTSVNISSQRNWFQKSEETRQKEMIHKYQRKYHAKGKE
jgi:hypothetical protein